MSWRTRWRRRRLAASLRRAARTAARPHIWRRQVLLCHRAGAVRPLLLEVAALVESADPADEAIATVHWLVTNGCESPLYNPDVPAVELEAALERVAAGLRESESEALTRWVTAS